MQSSTAKFQTSKKRQVENAQTVFDLEERMAQFGEKIIVFCKAVSKDEITRPLVNQLVRSATSIGANYCEANNASSKRDFRNKAYIAKKEAEETKHWLRMFNAAKPRQREMLRTFWQEAHEFVLILQTIINKVNKKQS